MYSVDFAIIEKLQHQGDWQELTRIMVEAARRLERGGAKLLVICTNTMHRMADEVERGISIPLLHIVDAVAEKILEKGISQVALLGTRFTMEQEFYRGRLEKKHGLQVVIPDRAGVEAVHRIIYEELVHGTILEESRQAYLAVIERLVVRGAQGVVLGCTEIPLLVRQADIDIPLFDTTTIHAIKAVEMALET